MGPIWTNVGLIWTNVGPIWTNVSPTWTNVREFLTHANLTLKLDIQLCIELAGSEIIGHSVFYSACILNPCVRNRIVDIQQIKNLKTYPHGFNKSENGFMRIKIACPGFFCIRVYE